MSDRATLLRLLRELQTADRTERVFIIEEAIVKLFDAVREELNNDIDRLRADLQATRESRDQTSEALNQTIGQREALRDESEQLRTELKITADWLETCLFTPGTGEYLEGRWPGPRQRLEKLRAALKPKGAA